MWPDRVLNPGPLTYQSGALSTALHGPVCDKSKQGLGTTFPVASALIGSQSSR